VEGCWFNALPCPPMMRFRCPSVPSRALGRDEEEIDSGSTTNCNRPKGALDRCPVAPVALCRSRRAQCTAANRARPFEREGKKLYSISLE
jgi:hypothetical protein